MDLIITHLNIEPWLPHLNIEPWIRVGCTHVPRAFSARTRLPLWAFQALQDHVQLLTKTAPRLRGRVVPVGLANQNSVAFCSPAKSVQERKQLLVVLSAKKKKKLAKIVEVPTSLGKMQQRKPRIPVGKAPAHARKGPGVVALAVDCNTRSSSVQEPRFPCFPIESTHTQRWQEAHT